LYISFISSKFTPIHEQKQVFFNFELLALFFIF